MKTIKIGIIGWGFMGRTHAHALRAMPLFYPGAGFRAEIAGICSRRLEKAREAAEELNVPYYTDDYRQLLAREEIDAVSVCTPNALHEEIALAALKAGKHLYIDKPLADTAQGARRIADQAEKSGVFTRMVFNNRYLPVTLRARELVDQGRIGRVLSFEGRYLHSGSIDPNKPIGWKQTLQGGVLLDLGSHVLDLITWLCGYPEAVFCAQRTLYDTRPTREGGATRDLSDDQTLMLLRLPGGAMGQVEASKIATGANDELTVEIRGEKGALAFDLMQPNYLRFYDNTRPEAPLGGERGFQWIETVARYPAPGGTFLPPKNSIGWDRGHLHCYYTFLDCLARGAAPDNGVGEGARLQMLMERAAQSAAQGRWVDTGDL
ncbi:MAG: Gfo/Idh/MocA family oxidoreductase [Eubacteriales bacterium]|nr:Gfo/Idh/MocA family oxidoreductase [Clostridiales bacterium]MDD6932153.1 Gfo/Idh/MocA family oxidoreductase [Eubacteriales bacterium]MDY2601218.1 Gfo/Idh/MocA family oxidoreductase [Eubacteriales bacterium]